MEQILGKAASALQQYKIQVDSVQLVGQSANLIYKVTDIHKNNYSLRFHQSNSATMENIWSDTAVIASEMVWLEALAEGTDIITPKPYRNKQGQFITNVNGVSCTLISWVEGEQKPFVPTVEDAELVGDMIGKLHKQSAAWDVPASFTRPSFDQNRISQALEKIKALAANGTLDPADSAVLIEAGNKAILMNDCLDRNRDSWGVIHADLIPSNFIFNNGEACPIDFGACGFGYFLGDLGWAFSYIHPAFRQSMIAAYAQHFPLPQDHITLLEGFFVATQLETMNFWLGLPDVMEWLPDHIGKLAQREFRHYIREESFLFTGTPYWE
ncbi:phosphotransferase enzyme family protein [Paenibacillus sp. GCM10012306]|uniref:phosphotransferase enzyme family protein n=1 Tax=Paenibacillus sp. GCM10012306 TaxID=3317342 RepID=UPI003619610F